MDLKGKGSPITQRLTFVLLSVGAQMIKGYVFARTDYFMKVIEYNAFRIS